jgi:hypothetical protein
MPFASWADYLCGHDGAEESNQDISSSGERFNQGAEPVENFKGEEATLRPQETTVYSNTTPQHPATLPTWPQSSPGILPPPKEEEPKEPTSRRQ